MPNAGTDGSLTLCTNDTATLAQLNAAITGEDGGGVWSPAFAPNVTTYTYTVAATGACTVDDTSTVSVSYDALPNAGVDGSLTICAGDTVTLAQLNTAITGEDAGGTWSPALAGAGTYTYTVTATAPCTVDDTSEVIVTEQAPTINISSGPTCSFDLLTYSVGVTVSSGTVTSTAGTVTNTSGNLWTISGVLSGVNIVITVTDSDTCTNNLSVSAPNCACPIINPPASGGNQEYCTGDVIPTLTASVGVGETVDWYDATSGGTLLLSGNASYTPIGGGTYYAESREIVSGCTSSTRTSIILTENPLPIAPVSGGNQTECEQNPIQTLTATATPPAGSSVVWYNALSGGSVVGSPTFNSVGTVTYYAESVNGTTGCLSASRTPVTLTIQTCTSDLSLTKTVDNSTPSIGDVITFTLTVLNSGPFDVSGVQVQDVLPVGLINITATPSVGTYSTGSGIWDLGTTLVNGGSVTLTISAEISPQCGTITNTAEIISSGFADPDSTPNNGG